jgi:hypothetical protein
MNVVSLSLALLVAVGPPAGAEGPHEEAPANEPTTEEEIWTPERVSLDLTIFFSVLAAGGLGLLIAGAVLTVDELRDCPRDERFRASVAPCGDAWIGKGMMLGGGVLTAGAGIGLSLSAVRLARIRSERAPMADVSPGRLLVRF